MSEYSNNNNYSAFPIFSWAWTLALLTLGATHCLADDGPNEILQSLTTTGVEISSGESLKLPEPVLADNLNAPAQRKQIEAIAEGRNSYEALTRRAVVAPFVLKISPDSAEQKRQGKQVDLYFVAYGDLKKINNDELFTGQINLSPGDEKSENAGWAKLLTNEELTKRGLPLAQQPADPRYIASELTLLDKVRLSTLTRSVKNSSDNSVLIATQLVTDKNNQDLNLWRAITRDDSGSRQTGTPQAYSGLGGYLKATKLVEPEGAVFIELHVAFAEPPAWFNGANLLGSKLPIVAQDSVRKLRRNLEKK